jgi:hypothetical protein
MDPGPHPRPNQGQGCPTLFGSGGAIVLRSAYLPTEVAHETLLGGPRSAPTPGDHRPPGPAPRCLPACQLVMRERSGWRELDSNHRSPRKTRRSRGIGSRLRRLSVGGESSRADMSPSRNLCHAVLTVRIRLPPAVSRLRTRFAINPAAPRGRIGLSPRDRRHVGGQGSSAFTTSSEKTSTIPALSTVPIGVPETSSSPPSAIVPGVAHPQTPRRASTCIAQSRMDWKVAHRSGALQGACLAG